MKKFIPFLFVLLYACDTGNLDVIADLPRTLSEVSGIESAENPNLIWMINDSGNKPKLYAVDLSGTIKRALKIRSKNHDWEDLTSDKSGNIYIGDFGNNRNDRKNLVILKISKDSLNSTKKVSPERITFYYPDQKKFPPSNNKLFFDCESFFHYNDSLYLFTKSRSRNQLGLTKLYKIPATKGNHEAEYISSISTCNDYGCWVTAADINDSGNKIALLTEHSVWIISDTKSSDFLKGSIKQYPFNFTSQSESVLFKNDSTLYIADERSKGKGGNLYEFSLHEYAENH